MLPFMALKILVTRISINHTEMFHKNKCYGKSVTAFQWNCKILSMEDNQHLTKTGIIPLKLFVFGKKLLAATIL